MLQNALNTIVLKDMRSNRDNISQAVLAVEVQHKESKSESHTLTSSVLARLIFTVVLFE